MACGKCIPCLVNRRNDWSFRLEQEWRASKGGAIFVTLTYDEKHIPSDYSLRKKDVQLFMKRLRKHEKHNRIRYFAVGEYGTKGGRPHYHILLFNADIDLVKRAWVDSKGKPIGIVHCGKVTGASVAYVTKYIVQREDLDDGREKPFSLMSRAYGIGGKYLTDVMVAWHREDGRNYCIRDGQKIRLPRFYKDKIFYGKQKEVVARDSQLRSIEQKEKERKFWEDRYGSQWAERKREAVEAVIQRVKQKVSYTQKF